jgi:soluble lytic murein transglycosylase-like protein
MKVVLGILGGLTALLATPVSAGTVYKCVGSDGVPSYVSKPVAAASCSVISQYAPGTRKSTPSTTPTLRPPSSKASASVPVVAPTTSSTPMRAAVASAGVRRRVSGEVYSYMQDGVRHYSSARPQQTASIHGLRSIAYSFMETCYACALNPGVDFGVVRLNTSAYLGEISAASREFGVDEAVVRAVIHAESAYNPTALSRAGAQGLMQLMPATAERFGVNDSFDAGQNIRGGVQYLAWLLKRFNGDLTLAAAGYNAGEGAVARYGGVPPYAETQRYVQRVGTLAERYRSALLSAH